MVRFRTFRNTDPPHVASIWRNCLTQPGLLHPISVDLLENLVFGKLHFDYAGMVLAWDGKVPVGFVHASFGANAAGDGLSTDVGIISMLAVCSDLVDATVGAGLLAQAEQYLIERGAKELICGAMGPRVPFYLGLYGSAYPPGILESDSVLRHLLSESGYEKSARTEIYRRDLHDFHPVIDRQQIQLRRKTNLDVTVDPPMANWWDASTMGDWDLMKCELTMRGTSDPLGSTLLRIMPSTDPRRPGLGVGVLDVDVRPEHQRQGIGTLLMGESLRLVMPQGVTRLEGIVDQRDAARAGLFAKLGMRIVERAAVYRKKVA